MSWMGLEICELNKKERQMLNAYRASQNYTLNNVYKSPSKKKREAYSACIADMIRNDGFDMRITFATTYQFSCAYRIKREDGIYLVYHTRCNRFEFQIAEVEE